MLWLDLGTKFFVIVRAIGVDADINRVLYSSRKYPIPQFGAIIQYVLQEDQGEIHTHILFLSNCPLLCYLCCINHNCVLQVKSFHFLDLPVCGC